MAKLEKDLKINNPLSGDDLRSIGEQMSNNRHGGDGFAISWQDMEAFICFGETAAKDEDPSKSRDRARVLNDVRAKLKDEMKVCRRGPPRNICRRHRAFGDRPGRPAGDLGAGRYADRRFPLCAAGFVGGAATRRRADLRGGRLSR